MSAWLPWCRPTPGRTAAKALGKITQGLDSLQTPMPLDVEQAQGTSIILAAIVSSCIHLQTSQIISDHLDHTAAPAAHIVLCTSLNHSTMHHTSLGTRQTSRPRPLLVLLLLLGTSCSANQLQAPPLTDSVLQELASHLGVDASTLQQPQAAWDSSSLSIHRRLEGKGFHKTLHLHLQAAAAALPQGTEGCHLSLLQPLPSSIFADPYQLEDLTRPSGSGSTRKAGYAYTFKLLGPLDLEL